MVTGLCIPVASIVDAATVGRTYQLDGNVLKVGKNQGQWYCVVVFNQGANHG